MEEESRKLKKDPRVEAKKESRRRNDHKRRSGAFTQEDPAEVVARRTSKKSTTNDRAAYFQSSGSPEDFPLRTPTPKLSSALHSGTPIPLSAFSPPQSDSPQAGIPVASDTRLVETTGSSHSRHVSKDSQSRPRTRTLEERFVERTQAAAPSGNRLRGVSLQSSAQEVVNDSIGFPSVEPSPPLEVIPSRAGRPKISKPLSRPLSPIRNPIAAKAGTPHSSSTTDAKKILQLMKTTCGRMTGILSFRTSVSSTWTSGYCAINVATGSLIYQTKGEVSLAKTLIPDLRGCQVRTLYDSESRATFLDVYSRKTNIGIHLRPRVPETFDSWLAALLCWQPIRPKGVPNKASKTHEPQTPERRLGDNKRNSGSFQPKDAAIIKVGKMLMYDRGGRSGVVSPPPGNRRIATPGALKTTSKHWRRISCTLQENGHFKIFVEPESSLEAVIPLSALSRCSIQRLDPSILDDEYCLAIYPQYTSSPSPDSIHRTVYLALESRVYFEVWFVLLRAFTIPELYGPQTASPNSKSKDLDAATVSLKFPSCDLFRVERMLSLRITEAKLHPERVLSSHSTSSQTADAGDFASVVGNYYAELQLDGEVRARTAVKKDTSTPFWREDFEFVDVPPVFSSAFIELKTLNPGQKDWTIAHAPPDLEEENMNPQTIEGDIEVSPLDLTYGTVDLRLDDLERAIDTERWWPIINEQEEMIGEIFMKVRVEELVVLMGRDYAAISELLHTFPNGLTNQITQTAHTELKRLSEILLNIFQVSGHASAWLMSLVEDEIDSVHRETPVSKFRYGRRIASNDSLESGIEREMFLRDLGKNASVEANLLFRGNSLLTKALDLHMRRLGKEYLEDTLSEKMRDIDESDPECEVDPHRVKNPEDLERNWRNLKALTENIWESIASSALRCPPELRVIMRRIRDCAEDRYGDFLRSVAYSSVSGFLFLRFFTPAVLNPKLFGLLKGQYPPSFRILCLLTGILDHPRPRAQRTLTLITKTLQTLANMTTFGAKEPWMEPMNIFLNTHRQQFKTFVDEICDISSDRATSAIPPSYATPITILGRLPGTSREGFPSLPYLIDQARECASLVDVWLDAKCEFDDGSDWSDQLQRFDMLCEESRGKAKRCLTKAEKSTRSSGALDPKWEELVEQMQRKGRSREMNGQDSPTIPAVDNISNVNSSTSSLAESYFYRRNAAMHGNAQFRSSPGASHLAATTSPQSPLSPDEATSEEMDSESSNTPPGSSSGAWEPGQSPSMDHTRPMSSDVYDSDTGMENSSDVIGSSIYNLTPMKSNRDSAATAKAIPVPGAVPRRSSGGPPNGNGNSNGSNKKGSRNAYGLRHTSDRTELSKSAASSRSNPPSKPGSRDSQSVNYQPVRSLYRLHASNGSPGAADSSASLGRKSPSSREGRPGLREGVFGGVFRKKTKERDREDSWKGGGISN